MAKAFPIYVETLSSNSQAAFTMQDSKSLGEKKQGKVIYSEYEAFYLVENNNAQAVYRNKKISADELNSIFSRRCKNFLINYPAFRDLRKKGHIVKSGLKFGSEFRVYTSKKDTHATWILFPVSQSLKINWEDFIAKSRVAHSAGKNLLIAIVDSQQDVTFYEVKWTKP
jgi:tRNA-intron endonuclease, archaea type